MLYVCAAKFNVTENLKKNFLGELNKAQAQCILLTVSPTTLELADRNCSNTLGYLQRDTHLETQTQNGSPTQYL